MTSLPISNPAPALRETVYSYLSRLAATWRTGPTDLAYDMAAPFKRLLDQDPEAIERLMQWAGLTPDQMDEMLSWTGVRAGNVRMEFRGELFVSRALRNPVMRGCPVCLREDAADHDGPATAAMVMRGDWQMREVSLCIRHSHPLVPLWTAEAPRDRYDIASRLSVIGANILSGVLDQPLEAATAYDLWLDGRLEDGRDSTWLRGQSLFATTYFCRLLGTALLREGTSGAEIPTRAAHVAGFNVLRRGELAIRNALDLIAGRARCERGEPSKAFGVMFDKFGRDYLEEEGFAPFRKILRDCILDHWPVAPGEALLGEVVEVRRLHSVITASQETGVGPAVLEHFLKEAGAIPEQDDRPQSRRIFDAQAYAELLREIPTLVGPIAMREAMGATKQELAALEEEALLLPRTRVPKVKNPWRVSDGIALVTALTAEAIPVAQEDDDWETLLLTLRRRRVSIAAQVAAIRDGRLTVGQRDGVAGFHGIVVPKREVEGMAAPLHDARSAVLDEVPGTMAAAEFARSVGLRDGGTFLALIEAGHVPAQRILNSRTGRPQFRMTPDDMAVFHRKFVTLTTLAAETGQHRNTLKATLASGRIVPFSPDGQGFGQVYLRRDVVGVMGRG